METISTIAIVLFSIIIHEVSHGYAALMLGDKTAKYAGRLTLNPLKHIDPFGTVILPIVLAIATAGQFVFGWAKPVPYNPYNLSNQKWGEAIVAIAGPISNILIIAVFVALLKVGVATSFANQAFIDMSEHVILVNLLLACFNLVPIPPLDGSKILFSFLPHAYANVRRTMERFSLPLLIIFILLVWDKFFMGILYIAQYILPPGVL